MNKRQRERLLKLADFLEVLPEKNFDMGHFQPYIDTIMDEMSLRHFNPEKPLGSPAEEIACGTACCVAGWASIVHQGTWPKNDEGIFEIDDGIFRKFFGLSERDTHNICFSESLLFKKERKALGLGDNTKFTPEIKAKQIRLVVEKS